MTAVDRRDERFVPLCSNSTYDDRIWDRQDAMWDREMKRWDAERALWTVKEERLQQQIADLQALVVSTVCMVSLDIA